MTDDHEWEMRANCRGCDPDLFFPERGDMLAIRQAKAVCSGCSVRAECLEANLHETDGVWGNTTPRERQRMRGQRIRARRSTVKHGSRSCYAMGCRRPECVEANAAYQRSRRLA